MEPKKAKDHSKHKIFVVDDHPLFREGLVRVLKKEIDLTVCGEAKTGEETVKQLETIKPDLVIVDISLEGMNGIDLTKKLRSLYPKLPILILSMHNESMHAERALRAGAKGYVMKREEGPKLLEAVHRVLQGHIYVSKAVDELMLQKLVLGGASATPVDALTEREFEIFRLIGEGYGSRQIADELNVSIKTVETHRENIREKLNLDSTFELVQHAIHWIHHESD